MNLEVEIVRNTCNVCVTINRDNLEIPNDETQSIFRIYFPINQNFVIDIVDNSEEFVCQIVGVYTWELPDTSPPVTGRRVRSPSPPARHRSPSLLPSNRRRAHSPSPPSSPLAEGRKRNRYEETSNENYSLSTATLRSGEYFQASLPLYNTHSETSSSLIDRNNQNPGSSIAAATLAADNLANSSFNSSNSEGFELDFISGLLSSLNRDIEEEED